MHVLIIPSWYPTPHDPIKGIFFREQAHALAQLGIKVGVIYPHLVSLRYAHKMIGQTIGLIQEKDQNVLTYYYYGINYFPFITRGRAWLFQRTGMRLFNEYIKDNGLPDILHVHSALNGGILGTAIKNIYSIPLVLTEHATSYARQILTAWQKKMVNEIFSASDRLVAVSLQFAELLGQQFPATKERWKWIPNVVDNIFLDRPFLKENPEPIKFAFLNVALMTEKKGQKDLIASFARSFAGQTEVELWLGGDGPIRNDLEALAQELNITAQVRFMGRLNREQVAEAMQAASVFVLSSHYETFGVVLIEALASGIPVIATRCGGPESIVSEKEGILVPVGDREALSRAMKTIKKNINQYDSHVLRTNCLNRFGANTVATQLKSLYTNLLKSKMQASNNGVNQ